MAECLITRRGSNLEINGILEEYKVYAGENISAGDFVQFVNSKQYEAIESSDIGINTQGVGQRRAIVINDNKVAMLNRVFNSSSNMPLSFFIVSIGSDGVLTYTGETILVDSNAYAGYYYNIIPLPNGSDYLVTHTYNSNRTLRCAVFTTDENTIRRRITSYSVSSIQSVRWCEGIVIEGTNNVMLFASRDNSLFLTCALVEVRDTSLYSSSSTTLLETSDPLNEFRFNICKITKNKYLVMHPYTSDRHLYGTLVEIDNLLNVSVVESVAIDETIGSGVMTAAVPLGQDFLIIQSHESSPPVGSSLSATLLGVQDDEVVIKIEKTFAPESITDGIWYVENVDGVVSVIHTGYTDGVQHYSDSGLAETQIRIKADNSFGFRYNQLTDQFFQGSNNSYVGNIKISSGELFLLFTMGATYNNGLCLKNTIGELQATSYTNKIDGVSTQNGNGGETIKVFEPEKTLP